uniref:CSON000729 protein n=1 Tax=Culicoides sonorensis TaxID=179676 RepID=A0A336MF20_CULSO
MSSNPLKSQNPTAEDLFYENLTLGLAKVLTNIPRITNINFEKRQPCEKAQITAWEQRHNVYLPDDMKRFYLSTDGFNFCWSYQYSPNDVRKVGHINFPHLIQITLVRENLETIMNSPNRHSLSTPSALRRQLSDSPSNSNSPNLNSKSKIFELSNILDLAKVCMVYETPEVSHTKIYILEMGSYRWRFLADSFTEYLRMCIVHLGLPYWELCFSSVGLPSWTEQLFLLLAPHLLEKTENRRNRSLYATADNPPYNTLDPSVFRSKPRCSRQPAKR